MENTNSVQAAVTDKKQWDAAAPGWLSWDHWLEKSFETVNQRLLDLAHVEENQFVLDLGSGTGYPSLIAAQRVGKSGFVVGLDFSERMVEAARENATKKGIRNVGFRVADITKLLFADSQLDAIFSRFCLMFVPSPETTLKEVFKVLKRNRYFAAAVWASQEKNPMPMKVLQDYVQLPPVDPSAPGMHRFGTPGVLSDMMRQAGFVEVAEEEVEAPEIFPSGKDYADHFFAMVASVRPQLEAMSEERRKEVAERLASAAEEYRKGDHVELPRAALIVSGKKPLK